MRLMKQILSTGCLVLIAATARPELLSQRVTEVLGQLPNGDADAGFSAWINDGGRNQFTLGEQISFNFRAEADVHVSIAYVDSQGILSLIQPDVSGNGNLLKGGVVSSFPAPNSGMVIQIEPPLGTEQIYFVATRSPPRQDVFESEVNTGGDSSTLFQAADSVRLAEDYVASITATNAANEVAVVTLENRITERPDGPEYTSRDIVTYFSKRGTRAITRPKLDANIQFESNSSVLSEEAKQNLDVWGESFLHPYLSDSAFQIGGHTDDVGSESYNLELSEKRAESVREYLSRKFRIEAERFEVVGHGEAAPRVDNRDQTTRAVNRRVEFRQLNDQEH